MLSLGRDAINAWRHYVGHTVFWPPPPPRRPCPGLGAIHTATAALSSSSYIQYCAVMQPSLGDPDQYQYWSITSLFLYIKPSLLLVQYSLISTISPTKKKTLTYFKFNVCSSLVLYALRIYPPLEVGINRFLDFHFKKSTHEKIIQTVFKKGISVAFSL